VCVYVCVCVLKLICAFLVCVVCSSGVRNANQSELKKIVTEPHEEHLMLSPDYSFLEHLLPKLSRRICFTASEPPRPVKQKPPGKMIMSFADET